MTAQDLGEEIVARDGASGQVGVCAGQVTLDRNNQRKEEEIAAIHRCDLFAGY